MAENHPILWDMLRKKYQNIEEISKHIQEFEYEDKQNLDNMDNIYNFFENEDEKNRDENLNKVSISEINNGPNIVYNLFNNKDITNKLNDPDIVYMYDGKNKIIENQLFNDYEYLYKFICPDNIVFSKNFVFQEDGKFNDCNFNNSIIRTIFYNINDEYQDIYKDLNLSYNIKLKNETELDKKDKNNILNLDFNNTVYSSDADTAYDQIKQKHNSSFNIDEKYNFIIEINGKTYASRKEFNDVKYKENTTNFLKQNDIKNIFNFDKKDDIDNYIKTLSINFFLPNELREIQSVDEFKKKILLFDILTDIKRLHIFKDFINNVKNNSFIGVYVTEEPYLYFYATNICNIPSILINYNKNKLIYSNIFDINLHSSLNINTETIKQIEEITKQIIISIDTIYKNPSIKSEILNNINNIQKKILLVNEFLDNFTFNLQDKTAYLILKDDRNKTFDYRRKIINYFKSLEININNNKDFVENFNKLTNEILSFINEKDTTNHNSYAYIINIISDIESKIKLLIENYKLLQNYKILNSTYEIINVSHIVNTIDSNKSSLKEIYNMFYKDYFKKLEGAYISAHTRYYEYTLDLDFLYNGDNISNIEPKKKIISNSYQKYFDVISKKYNQKGGMFVFNNSNSENTNNIININSLTKEAYNRSNGVQHISSNLTPMQLEYIQKNEEDSDPCFLKFLKIHTSISSNSEYFTNNIINYENDFSPHSMGYIIEREANNSLIFDFLIYLNERLLNIDEDQMLNIREKKEKNPNYYFYTNIKFIEIILKNHFELVYFNEEVLQKKYKNNKKTKIYEDNLSYFKVLNHRIHKEEQVIKLLFNKGHEKKIYDFLKDQFTEYYNKLQNINQIPNPKKLFEKRGVAAKTIKDQMDCTNIFDDFLLIGTENEVIKEFKTNFFNIIISKLIFHKGNDGIFSFLRNVDIKQIELVSSVNPLYKYNNYNHKMFDNTYVTYYYGNISISDYLKKIKYINNVGDGKKDILESITNLDKNKYNRFYKIYTEPEILNSKNQDETIGGTSINEEMSEQLKYYILTNSIIINLIQKIENIKYSKKEEFNIKLFFKKVKKIKDFIEVNIVVEKSTLPFKFYFYTKLVDSKYYFNTLKNVEYGHQYLDFLMKNRIMNNVQILEYGKFIRKYINEVIEVFKEINISKEIDNITKFQYILKFMTYELYCLFDLLDQFNYCINMKSIQVSLNRLYSTCINIMKYISKSISFDIIDFPKYIELTESEKEEIKSDIIKEKEAKSTLAAKGELKKVPKRLNASNETSTSVNLPEVTQQFPVQQLKLPIGGNNNPVKIKKRIRYLLRKTKKNMLKLQRKTIKN